MLEKIVIKGAKENNLKNLDVEIPRNKLVVLTGVSGSGKSTLAFGTIFAEGQRRFMESLSSYARQFLGQIQKPAVDSIEGLSPCIAINQKTTSHNPRSTVGTVTEIYDYLRLLYARVGEAYCPECGKKITRQSIDQIVGAVFGSFKDKLVMIEAPVVRGAKGSFTKDFEGWKRSGYARVKVDGSIYMLDEQIELDKNLRHTISVIVDRVKIADDEIARITESIETALRLTEGLVAVDDKTFSNKYACIDCGISIEDLEPRAFSFNSPFGACPNCTGLGFTFEIDENLIIPDRDKTIAEGAIVASGWNFDGGKIADMTFKALSKKFGVGMHDKIRDISPDILHKILYGCDEKLNYELSGSTYSYEYMGKYEGIIPNLKRRWHETQSEFMRAEIGKLMVKTTCPLCHGKRLKRESLAVRVGQHDDGPSLNISDLTALSIKDTLKFFDELKLTKTQEQTAERIIREVRARLNFLMNVGLHYLTLGRSADSLSGGESQRIRLATQIGSGLVGVLYILDEPSIGLHQHDNDKLLATLKKLRDLGNTLIVVEHDEDTIRAADFIVDIGPRAGAHGGELVVAGTLPQVMACQKSLTGQYLNGERKILCPERYRSTSPDRFIEVTGASENNLKHIDVKFPLGLLTAVTGVSGSGKSSLVNKILYPALHNVLNKGCMPVGLHDMLSGFEHIDKVINIDQSPIGRTPRSNPATYTEVFGPIRELFANTRDAKERGYTGGRFSFNVRGGRCDNCDGEGIRRIEMHFLPDVFVACEVCGGKRFNRETLEVKYKGKSIYDVLEMTVDEAVEFFENIPNIYKKLKTIQDVGLGYIRLGQSATTLSGGEAQRVKLAKELSRASTGKTLYILDEPTTGLHSYDVQKLIDILQRLVDANNTVIVIEHNLDVIKVCDNIIDLGPSGGDEGGCVIATGNPREIVADSNSLTGKYLKSYFISR
ncbi:MAG: excinuclease ABC subunit UvrA [Christensenellaceae bacterium]|jgi:excinuclease ABC subunit A|nr:excinuclease ABC subunit UvrA [Christensenellaceae bacterium]